MAKVILPAAGSPLGLGNIVPPSAGVGNVPTIIAPKIDIETSDYQSVFEGDNEIDAQVKIAMKTVKGSGYAVESVGQNFEKITKLDESAKVRLDSETRSALKRLVQNGDIRIDRIVVISAEDEDSQGFDWAEVQVEYTNNRVTNKQSRKVTKRISDIQRLARR